MSVPVPNLDDRSFADLVESARARIQQVDPEWTDLSVHDPGIVLVEAFAHLTDILLYRLNQVPDRLYAVYLNLLGTALRPPAAAEVTLEFTRPQGQGRVRIPRGTRVGCPPGPPGTALPVFTTLADGVLDDGELSVRVPAQDAALHEAVVVGTGSGQPGQTFTLPGAPLVAGPGLSVGIEVPAGTSPGGGDALLVAGRTFRICREVEVFADAGPGEPVVRVDRTAGTVTFAWFEPDGDGPRPVVPAPGAQVRAWYRSGGGERGNVPPGRVTVPRDALPGGVTVTNPAPAVGGADVEALDRALRRAPQDFQARDRAVTARDYEVLAARHAGVVRARAITRRDLWSFAAAGEVEVVLVPMVPVTERPDGQVSRAALLVHAREDVRAQVEAYLRERATIGASPRVGWGRYKQVRVTARVVVRPDEDPDAVRARITARLARVINPLAPAGTSGYGSDFGRPLRVSNLYREMEQSEPGVLFVDRVRLELDQVPDAEAVALAAVGDRPGTWFVAQRDTLFATTNAADGWEAFGSFPGETVRAVAPYPPPAPGRAAATRHPGLVGLVTNLGEGARVHVSTDLGQTWRRVAELGFPLADLAWIDRDGVPVLLVVGENGLYEVTLGDDAVPVQNLVDPKRPDLGFHSVDTFVDVRGRAGVVLAAEGAGGVWLSASGGAPQSFRAIRMAGEDIRFVTAQYDGPSVFLWAGRSVPDGDGVGCLRLRLDELAHVDVGSLLTAWDDLRAGWTGGSCWQVAVLGDRAYAATQGGGVVTLPLREAPLTWHGPDVNAGLPLRDRRRFAPLRAVSAAALPDGSTIVLAAGVQGVHRSVDGGTGWRPVARRTVDDVVTLPPTWLFCSGEHSVEVVRADG